MNKKLISLLSILSLSLSLPLIPVNAAVKAGGACTKLGIKSIVSGKTFTCIKSGKKLAWNKGVVVTKSTPSTLEYELQNSNGRVTLVLKSDEISRQLETRGIYSNLVISLTGNGSNLFIVFFLRDYQSAKGETFGFELWKKTVFDGADLKIAIDENMALGSEPNIFYDAGDNDVNPYNRIKWLSEVKVDPSKILKSFSGFLIQSAPEVTTNSANTNKTSQPLSVPTQKPTPTPTPTQVKAIYKIGEVGPGQGIIFITPQLGQEMFSGRTDILVPTGRYYEMHTQSLGYVSSTSNPTELVSKFRGGGYSDWFIPSIDELKTLEEISRRSWTNYNLWGQINPTMEVCLSSTVSGGKNILLRNTGRTALETFETTFAYICAVRSFQTK